MPGYDEFVDPNSAIARIIAQMQGAADRSNPGPGPGMPGDLPVSSAPQPGEAQPTEDSLESLRYMRNGRSPYDTGMQGEMGPGSPEELIRKLLSQMGR